MDEKNKNYMVHIVVNMSVYVEDAEDKDVAVNIACDQCMARLHQSLSGYAKITIEESK